MKRILSLLLVLVLVGTMLVACGDDKGGGAFVPDDGPRPDPNPNKSGWWNNVDFSVDGEPATLTIQLSNLNDNELQPGTLYMKGPEALSGGTSSLEKVQNLVKQRNDSAQEELGISLMYGYCSEDWSKVASYIVDLESNNRGYDMYCDMMYDLVGASLTAGTFANLYKYMMDDKTGYFDFSSEFGYYEDLMEDMSLSYDKMYLIAGDYYMDVLRAMIVMPFNMEMYVDLVDQDDEDCQELYDLVDSGKWTWDELTNMSFIYSGGNETIESTDLLMALSVSGLSSNGMLYSTAFTNYKVKEVGGQTVYTLDTTCYAVNELFQKIASVSTWNGVLCDASVQGDVAGVLQVKEIFTAGRALFAGPQMLGVIEEEDFQNMEALSILPVPKVSTSYDYNTTVNTRARVGALGYHSSNGKMASAFIQYAHENSEKIIDEYFNGAMGGKYLSGSGAGVMLDLIYENLGDGKSSILDHVIDFRSGAGVYEYTLTKMLRGENFTAYESTIGGVYSTAAQRKQETLNKIMEDWYELE